MDCHTSRFVKLIVLLYLVNGIAPKVEFSNIKCENLDPDFDDFEYCYLKSVNRTYKYLSVKVRLHKKPVTKVKINLALMKRFSGYRPFLYNITIDGCRFTSNPSSNPIADFFFSLFRKYSNINHTCPVDHDIIVEKLPNSHANKQLTDVLPFPHGDYMFQSNWLAYDILRATVKVYYTLS